MAMKFEYYKDLSDRMIDADIQRDKAFRYYQKMRRIDWTLPEGVSALPGIRKVVDTGPSDAIAKAVQVMASRPPRLKMMPAISTPEGKARANMIERVLKWQLTTADRRRPVGVVNDVFESAALYGAVALNVMDLDHQIKIIDDEATAKKLQRARRTGRWVVNTFNPMDVHARRSPYGLESVLLCQQRPAHEVAAEYPTAAKALKNLIEASRDVKYKYYMDYETTCVWFEADGIDAQTIVPPTNHDMPFMYWVALMGGTTLDANEEHKYRPILYPVYMSDEWETKNVVDTLLTSDAIWKALPPVAAEEGNNTEETVYNSGDPGRRILKVPQGNTLRPLPSQTLDPALFQLAQDFKMRMQDSTVSTLIGGSDIPSGTSFAAMNLATQSALGALKPAKELTEKALAEMFTLMLLWTSYSGVALNAYNDDKRGEFGEEYVIEPDEIDEENIYISVELDPDEPTDKLQRANTATMLMQLGYPKRYALEDMGVEDPEKAIVEHYEERLLDLEYTKHEQAEMAAIQQEQMMAQQEQQMAAQQMAQQGSMAGAIPGGEGFNPAMGGLPPASAFPGGTREGVNGELGMGGEMV